MDTRTLHDHAWDALVSGAAPGVAAQAEAGTARSEAATTDAVAGCGAPSEVRSGFRVLSLEQYAASHARSLHQVHEH